MILLEDLDTEFGNIKIMKSKKDGSYSYFQEECYQSHINKHGVSTCGYVHVMYSIIKQADAKNVLLIGGAGGTLATMLQRSGCQVTVVDINPHAFTLAKKYFQMPDEVECVVGDGWAYLLNQHLRFDAIALDAFDADGTVPGHFKSQKFFEMAHKALRPRGVITMNMLVEHDFDMSADRVAMQMEDAGLPSILFDWQGKEWRNIILAGGMVEHMQIKASRKPSFVRHEMAGMLRRSPRW